MSEKEKEKRMHITIKLKKTLMQDYGVSTEMKRTIEVNYNGEMAENIREWIFEEFESRVISMDKEIDKK